MSPSRSNKAQRRPRVGLIINLIHLGRTGSFFNISLVEPASGPLLEMISAPMKFEIKKGSNRVIKDSKNSSLILLLVVE